MTTPVGAGDAPALDARVVRTHSDVLRVARRVLIEQGWQAVTHPTVARDAGYARATVYSHWPTRTDPLLGAFSRLAETLHQAPTGDLRADLINEMMMYRTGMAEHGLDRALAVLADLAASNVEIRQIRDTVVSDGEHVVRRLLEPVMTGHHLEAATMMICGAVLQWALLHGRLPSDEVITATVDLALAGLRPA